MARGSVKARVNAEGKTTSWRVVYELAPDPATGARRQKTESARTRKAAEALLTTRLAELDGGTYVARSAETFSAYLDRWFAVRSARWRPATVYQWGRWIERRIKPALGDVPVQQLTAARIEAFAADLGRELRASSAGQALLIVKYALRDAVRWGELAKSPAQFVRASGGPSKETRAWSVEEAGAFLDATQDDEDGPLWRLLLATGVRIGEALALRWEDIDAAGGWVTVRRTLTRAVGGFQEGAPKTASGVRRIAVGPDLRAALTRHTVRQMERRLEAARWVDEGRVFDNGHGALLPPGVARRRFYAAAAAAGLPAITLHGLRHTLTSALFTTGAPLKVIQEQLGHASARITLERYAHATAGSRTAAAAGIEEAYRGGRDHFVTFDPEDDGKRA